MSAICPECDTAVDIDELDADIGDELTCAECGALLRVASDSPLELELADDDEDDEKEEEEEKGEEGKTEDEETEVEDDD